MRPSTTTMPSYPNESPASSSPPRSIRPSAIRSVQRVSLAQRSILLLFWRDWEILFFIRCRPPGAVQMRAGLVLCVAAVVLVTARADAACPDLRAIDGKLGYGPRVSPDRCEGMYQSPIAGEA